MAKSAGRRAVAIDLMADHVLAEGIIASSLRPLAKAAGVSDRMLLYYFKDKAEIMAEVLARIAERLVMLMGGATRTKPLPLAALRRELAGLLFDDALWPYMRIWLEVASLAARGDMFYRSIGEQIGRGFLQWGAAQLDSATPALRITEAAQLLVSIEGMLLLKSIGLDDVCDAAV